MATAPNEISTFPDGTETLLIVDDEDAAPAHPQDRIHDQGLQRHQRMQWPGGDRDPRRPGAHDPRGAPGHQHAGGLRRGRPEDIKATRADLPVLIISGHINAETRNILEHLGQTDVVSKPYRLDELGRRLRNMLGESPVAKARA